MADSDSNPTTGVAREVTLTGTAQHCPSDVQRGFAARSDEAGVAPLATLRIVDENDYVIEAEAGRGGVGVVYRARDQRLGRIVAVKELQHDDPTARLRFDREMRITARLQHPGIVPVLEAGRWPSGAPFYAMKLVEGASLKTCIAQAQTLTARLALLPSLIAVAETMAYAHAHRVTHRDLKPGNVIIGAFGEAVVIDWGLAKELDQPDPIVDELGAAAFREQLDSGTRVGAIVGTPTYMPPEQASGAAVDQRADVYALGAMLYHLFAGLPPYNGTTSDDVLRQVLAGPPRPIDALVSGVPRELIAITAKAMARDPAARYPSAGELAQELRKFQTGQLVDTYRYSRRDLVRRWLRRHRGVALTAGLALVLLLAMGATALSRVLAESTRADRERDQAIRQRELAETAERTARRTAAEVILAHAASDVTRDPTMALAWLKRLDPVDSDLGRAHAIALNALSHPVAEQIWDAGKTPPEHLVFAPDGKSLLVAVVVQEVAVLDVASGAQIRRWPIDTEPTFLTSSADHRRVAFLASQYQIGVVDLDAAQLSHPTGCAGPLSAVALSPDGQRLACRGPGAAHVIDLERGGTIDWPEAAAWPVTTQLVWSPDSLELYAATGTASTIHVLDARRGTTRQLNLDASAPVTTVLAAGPAQLFVTTSDGRAALIDAAGGRTRWLAGAGPAGILAGASASAGVLAYRRVGEPAQLVEVASGRTQPLPASCYGSGTPAVSPSGRYVVVPCADDWFLLWDRSSSQAWTLAGQGGRGPVAFSPAEDRIATSSTDRQVRLWLVPDAAPLLAQHSGPSFHVLPAGPWLVTDSSFGTVTAIDPTSRKTHTWPLGHDMVYALAAGDGGRRFAAGTWEGQIVLFDSDALDAPPRLVGARGHPIWALAFDDTGNLLGDARTDAAHIWPLDGGPAVTLTGHTGEVHTIQLGHLGGERVAVTGGEDGTVRVWSLDGTLRRVLSGHTGAVKQVRFAGAALVSGSLDGTVRLWRLDRDDGTVIARHPGTVRALSVSRSHRFVASAAADGQVAVYDLESGHDFVLAAERGGVRSLEFDASEHVLLSSSTNGTLWSWDWQSGQVCVLLASGGLNAATVVRDGSAIVTAGTTGEVRLSTRTPAACLSADPDTWKASLAAITRAEATPAGSRGGGKE